MKLRAMKRMLYARYAAEIRWRKVLREANRRLWEIAPEVSLFPAYPLMNALLDNAALTV